MVASNRCAAALVVVLFCLARAAAQDAEVMQDAEVVKVEVSLVTVNVSVTDGSRRAVTGLRASDFLLSEEGREVSLEFFDSQGPASIVFVVDVSSSMRHEKWKRLTDGLKKFLANARDGNDYTLVTFGDRPRLVAECVGAEELWRSAAALEPYGNTALYDAVLMGLEALGRGRHRHKALVLLSDGRDTSSHARLADVEREALSRRATVYALGITDIVRADNQTFVREGKEILNDLAAATGGLAFFPEPQEIRAVLERINADLTNQYTLGYYAPEATPGWRNIQVSMPSAPHPYRLRYQQRYLKR